MARSWGDTVYDILTPINTWDAEDAHVADSNWPLSSTDAWNRPQWEITGTDSGQDDAWPQTLTTPNHVFSLYADGVGQVFCTVSAPDHRTTSTVLLPATCTAGEAMSLIGAGGYMVSVTGGPLGSFTPLRIEFLDYPVTENLLFTVANSALFGNPSLYDESALSGDAAYNNKTRPYRLQVVTKTGQFIREIITHESGTWCCTANEAASLEFTVMASGYDDMVADLLNPLYRVKLLNAYGLHVGTFRMSQPEHIHNSDAVMLKWTGLDNLVQLASEPIPDLRLEGYTLRAAVTAVLALQANTTPIKLAEMTDSCGRQLVSINLQNTTVLAALREMQAQLPKDVAGYFFLTATGGLQWIKEMGTDRKTIAIGERLQGITKKMRYSDIVTRIYAYGEGGDTRTRLTLLDAGESNEYIQDTAGIASYGILSTVVTETSINDADALLRFARRILEERSVPQIEYTVDVIDLARVQMAVPPGRDWTPDDGTNWAELYVGGNYQLVDAGTGTNTTIRLKRATFDLMNPLPVQIELDNRTYSISDILLEFQNRAKFPINIGFSEDAPGQGTRYPDVISAGPDGLRDGLGNDYSSDTAPPPIGTGDAGTSGDYARADHTHDGQEGSDAIPQPIGDAGAAGTGTALSRDDHVHTIDAAGVSSLSAALASDADPLGLAETPDPGTSEELSRADHIHPSSVTGIRHVSTLPAIPGSEWDWVIWDAPSGDGQIWTAYAGASAWTPMQAWTTKSGVVV